MTDGDSVSGGVFLRLCMDFTGSPVTFGAEVDAVCPSMYLTLEVNASKFDIQIVESTINLVVDFCHLFGEIHCSCSLSLENLL